MPTCKNDCKRYYRGHEPSPKGLGFCAHAEKINKRRKGRNGKMWIVRKTKRNVRRWVPVKTVRKQKSKVKGGMFPPAQGRAYMEAQYKHMKPLTPRQNPEIVQLKDYIKQLKSKLKNTKGKEQKSLIKAHITHLQAQIADLK